MSVKVTFSGTCYEKEFDTSGQARVHIEQIRRAGGYWVNIPSVKNEVFVPWHTIREARIQPQKDENED